MAEANTNNKIGILAKAQKQLSRTKTKVLQNLGKAEKTTDDVFKDHVQKTERQQEVAQHLQKELKTYSHCVKDLSLACKNLQNALSETYEPEWKGESKFKSQLQAFELLWNDYLQKLQDNVINPMNAYLQSFPVLKTKVSKRGRKLVDFDNSRHNLEVLQAAKRRDDAKISKAQDELKDVKRIFDELNNELHTELPEFYDSRVTFYADLYSKFFDAEYTLHTEVGKTCDSIQEIAQSLGKDFEHYKYKPKRPTSVTDAGSVNGETPITASPSLRSSNSSSQSPQKEPMYSNQDQANMPQVKRDSSSTSQLNGHKGEHPASEHPLSERPASERPVSERPVSLPRTLLSTQNSKKTLDDSDDNDDDDHDDDESEDDDKKDTNVYEVPVDPPKAKKQSLEESDNSDDSDSIGYEDDTKDEDALTTAPPNTLYMVQATHKYCGEDVDELSFEARELIYVIEFENPEEQDDGWQLGIKKSDGTKGVFPENFTQRLS